MLCTVLNHLRATPIWYHHYHSPDFTERQIEAQTGSVTLLRAELDLFNPMQHVMTADVIMYCRMSKVGVCSDIYMSTSVGMKATH